MCLLFAAINMVTQQKVVLVLVLFVGASTLIEAPLPNRAERATNPTLSNFFSRLSSLLRAFQR